MTGKAFHVDPDVLKNQGQAFVDIGTDFGNAAKRLETTLESLGTPWESADFGTAFGVIYEPLRDGMFTSVTSLAERLEAMGENLQQMSRDYSTSDDEGVRTVNEVPLPAA